LVQNPDLFMPRLADRQMAAAPVPDPDSPAPGQPWPLVRVRARAQPSGPESGRESAAPDHDQRAFRLDENFKVFRRLRVWG